MVCVNNRGTGRGNRVGDRLERLMYRFADLVKAAFAWWDNVPAVLRVVILLRFGLLPTTTELVRLVETLGQ